MIGPNQITSTLTQVSRNDGRMSLLCYVIVTRTLTALAYYSDEGIPVKQVGPGLSLRMMKVENGSVRLSWITRNNYTEPDWHFYLNGRPLDNIQPSRWKQFRTVSSLELVTNNQTNFELLMRDENILTVEAVTRQSPTEYTRLVFEKRAKLNIGGPPISCDPITTGKYCSRCTNGAVINVKRGQICYKHHSANKKIEFLKAIFLPVAVGCILFIAIILIITMICVKVWRSKHIKRNTALETAAEQKVSEILKGQSVLAVKKASQLRSLQSAMTLHKMSKTVFSQQNLMKHDSAGGQGISPSNMSFANITQALMERQKSRKEQLEAGKSMSANTAASKVTIPPNVAPGNITGSVNQPSSTTIKSINNPIIERLLANKLAKERAIVKNVMSSIKDSAKAAEEDTQQLPADSKDL